MKIDLINWDNVKPGSRVDLKFKFIRGDNGHISTYFIKHDYDLNNFTVYNPLTGEIESYNLTKTNFVEVNNIDDREHETNHNDLDINNIDVNDIMIFNEVIKDPTYELSPEKFFRIKNWDNKNKTCSLISLKSKFILHNIHWSDISPISGIFNLDSIIDADEMNNLKFNSISSTFSNNYHLYIKNDKYRKFIIIIVFNIYTREYGASLIDTTYQDESHDFKGFIESEISICFEKIFKKFYSNPMPKRREVYSRIDWKNDELFTAMKFKFKSWICLYDLYFDNIFPNTEPHNIILNDDMRKRIDSVKKGFERFRCILPEEYKRSKYLREFKEALETMLL